MKNITIQTPTQNYKYIVSIGNDILASAINDILSQYSEKNLYIVTNETVNNIYEDYFSNIIKNKTLDLHLLVLPDGEQFKNLTSIQKIYDFFADNQANRSSIAIAFGGGVIGDMTGYAAATYMRGMGYIQIPTTLLSQVDSSVGGKTGVNHSSGKNMIGVFNQPMQTIIDTSFLKTLPDREIIAGYAELIKAAFIKNKHLFEQLISIETHQIIKDHTFLIEAIYQACQIKATVVEEDEKEKGVRAILNFGHTLGHFLETHTGYKKYLHGEAVIVGMDFSAWFSMKKGLLSKQQFIRIHQHLYKLNINIYISNPSKKDFIELINHDKKASNHGIKFIGLKQIGNYHIFDHIKPEELWGSFQEYIGSNFSLVFME
jgi:3-dehydroquinate synthase